MSREQHIYNLTDASERKRTKNFNRLMKKYPRDKRETKANDFTFQLNLQTDCSFSPYTPAQAAFMAYTCYLSCAGICDRHTLSGVKEFVSDMQRAKLPYVIGCETFVESEGESKRIAVYSISTKNFKEFEKLFAENEEASFKNSLIVADKFEREFGSEAGEITAKLKARHEAGKAVTIKHAYYEIAKKLCAKLGKGEAVIDYLLEHFFECTGRERTVLTYPENPYYEYDLMRIMMRRASKLDEVKYADAQTFNSSVKALGGFCAYIAGKSESSDVDALIARVKALKLSALCVDTYHGLPLKAVAEACKKENILLLPGDFIDSPRKKFTLSKSDANEALSENVLALVGNQSAVNLDVEGGLFSAKAEKQFGTLPERIKIFSGIGKSLLS